MRVVVSISGSGLAQPGVDPDTASERRYLADAAARLADLAGRHQVLVTHGDQPHLDALLGASYLGGTTENLDIVNAEAQGAVGYVLTQELRNVLLPRRRVAALLTQVYVDPNDDAFRRPTATVGPRFTNQQARELEAQMHWSFRPEGGHWRRVVPELRPLAVIEAATVDMLLSSGVVVVCGASGIPVVTDFAGAQRGVPAVVSAELCTGRLAEEVEADRLVFLVDTPYQVDTSKMGLKVIAAGEVMPADASDEPQRRRLAAARHFVESTGAQAGIGPLREARAVLDGDLGLLIRPDPLRAVS